jgi:glycerol uptake facilitator-like aquaporin
VPFTANGQGWWIVYVLGPILGAQLGAGLHRLLIKPRYTV